MLSIIVAISDNGVIGNENKLAWHLPADLRYFKAVTTGHTIIMGRKTYASIGKVLPNRTNIVITRDKNFLAEGAKVFFSIEAALNVVDENENTFIIGGDEIFRAVLPFCSRLYITRVHDSFVGDVFFTEPDYSLWKKVSSQFHIKDDTNLHDYTFELWELNAYPKIL